MSRDFKLSLLILLAVEGFLLFLFPPSLLFDPSWLTGGDMASHMPTAAVLKDRLFGLKPLITWVHGNYGGFPLFLHYFPLPFILAALLSLAAPLAVAMKIEVFLTVLALPAAAFACLRNLGFRGLAPGLGAALTLLFLVTRENPMWGGNIASTMAGEFSYGLALALAVWLTGRLHRDVPAWRRPGRNAFIEALVAMGSGYPLLQVGFGSLWFAFRKRGFAYMALVHALAFSLAGLWLLPLIWRVPWTTPYNYSWDVLLREAIPTALWPAPAGIAAGFVARRVFLGGLKDGEAAVRAEARRYLLFQIGIALLGFGVAPLAGLVDIRFLPFAQVLVILLGAAGWADLFERFRAPRLVAGAAAAGVFIWAGFLSVNVTPWIRWDFTGFETKPLYKAFHGVNEFLRGTENDPRVVYEHADVTTDTGTVRAFELLPFFSGRSTLEGLYMQSSLSAPFVFALQAELSRVPSCPFPSYYVGGFDVARAVRHLRLFNADRIIAVTDRTSLELEASPDILPETSAFAPFRVYRVAGAGAGYVEPLKYRPYRIGPKDWRRVQYAWFRRSTLDVPLVVMPEKSPGEYVRGLPEWTAGGDGNALESMPRVPLEAPEGVPVEASAELGDNHIDVVTNRPGHPLLVKVSYHPDWRIAEGTGELYAVSPAFMLLVPRSPHVVLTFDTSSGVYFVGKVLTLLACLTGIVLVVCGRVRSRRERVEEERDLVLLRQRMAVLEDVPDAPLARWETLGGGVQAPAELQPGGRARLLLEGKGAEKAGSSPASVEGAGPPRPVLLALFIVLAAAISWNLAFRTGRDPVLLYNHAVSLYEKAEAAAGKGRGKGVPATAAREGDSSGSPFSEARKSFEAVLANFPSSPAVDHAAHYIMTIALQEGRREDVVRFTRDFLERYPDSRVAPEALYDRAVAERALGEADAAEAALGEVLTRYPGSDWAGHAAVRLVEWTSAASVLSRGKTLVGVGLYFEALPWLDAARQDTREGVGGEADFMAATARFHLSRYEDALQGFSEWVARNPGHPDVPVARFMMARCEMALQRYAEALRSLDEALALDPSLAARQPFASYNRMVREVIEHGSFGKGE